MDSNLNLTACIRIPLMGKTVFVWKNTLRAKPPESGFSAEDGEED